MTGLSYILNACGQSGGGGHMMSGGMMGGGMMGDGMMMQSPADNTRQNLPDPDSDGAKLVAKYCGQCHTPPKSSTQTADQWPRVIQRMKRYMGSQKKPAPDDERTQTILKYLTRHAR
jgi:cytochrome c553